MKILTLPSNQGKWKDVCAGVILEGTYYGSDYENKLPRRKKPSDNKSPRIRTRRFIFKLSFETELFFSVLLVSLPSPCLHFVSLQYVLSPFI